MNDREFLGYVELHCRTERALFARDHVDRLVALAGKPPIRWSCSEMSGPFGPPAFMAVRANVAMPLVEAARARFS